MAAFDFSSLRTVDLPKAKSAGWSEWKTCLTVAAIGLSVVAAPPTVIFGTAAYVNYHEATVVEHQEQTLIKEGTPYSVIDGRILLDSDPAHNHSVMRSRAERNAFLSTILIVAVGPQDHVRYTGSGTVLAGYKFNDHPIILSIRHVTDVGSKDFSGGRLFAVDKEGHMLGEIQQIDQAPHQEYKDYPTLSVFVGDHVNKKALAEIPGVRVAREVPAGLVQGNLNQMTNPGSSGGGFYNRSGEILGVVDGMNYTAAEDRHTAEVYGTSALKKMGGDPDGYVTQSTLLVGQSDIQSLAVGHVLHQLHELGGAPAESYQFTKAPVKDSFGFGFPGEIPAFYQGQINYDSKVSASMASSFSKMFDAERGKTSPHVTVKID